MPYDLPNCVAIDFEATGLDPRRGDRVISAAAAFPNGRRLYWRDDFTGLKEILEDASVDKVFTNAKYDLRISEYSGFKTKGKVWDTMIFCHLLDGRQDLDLESTAEKYLPSDRRKVTKEIDDFALANGYVNSKTKKPTFVPFTKLPPELLQKRNIGDADLTLRLFGRTYSTVRTVFPFLLEQEHRLLHVVKKMEDRGIEIDLDQVEQQIDMFYKIVEDVVQWAEGVIGHEGFNINAANDQIELMKKGGCWDTLVDRAKRNPKQYMTKGGRPKLDDWGLRTLHHPVAHMLLLGKAASKMASTFLVGVRKRCINGILYQTLNQCGTTTGRFSSSNPNLQNIPIEGDRRTAYTEAEADEAYEMTFTEYAPHLKRIFKVRKGYAHVHSDKSRAEIVYLAHYSRDPVLLEIMNKPGADIHQEICLRLYGEITKGLRTRTKAVVFGFMYGAGLETLARKIGSTEAVAQDTKQRLARILPGLPRWANELKGQVHGRGYVTTIHGRRHYLYPNEDYIVVNRMCQGSVGDEIKSRMLAIDDLLVSERIDGRVLLNIHDDLGTEVPADLAPSTAGKIHRIMEQTSHELILASPSSCDITYTRWSDLVEITDFKKVPTKKQHASIISEKAKKELAKRRTEEQAV